MDVLTYDELRVIEREERDKKSLSTLGDGFLDRYYSYVKDKQRVLDKSDDNLIAKKVKERTKSELFNARNSFKKIFEYRLKKVFDQVMLDLRMGVKPDFSGLITQEQKFYKEVNKLLLEHFNNLSERKLKKDNASSQVKDSNVLVRFVKDFPEFVWKDKTLGPFKAEDVANLPVDVVKLLFDKEVIQEVLSE
jgi:DNA replication initiation complex subunit (GINS family)